MRRDAVIVAAAGALMALVAALACRGGDPPVVAGDPTPTMTAAAAAAGCAPARPQPAGDATLTITSAGLERTYILHVPPQYDGARRLPLVLNFHGFGSNASEQASYSRLPAKADEEGFIVVTPEGTGDPRRWTLLPGTEPDDVAFARDLLDHLEATLCIDATRVFSAGMSNGAALSMRIACAMPERFTAVAAVTALIYPVTCPAGDPVAVVGFHGTADACVPFTGGRSACGAMLPVAPIEQSALNWAKRNGCAETPSITQLTQSVRVTAYSDCGDNVAVVLYVVDGGGHTWPGSVDVPRLGATTREVDATDLIWEFFAAQGNLAQ